MKSKPKPKPITFYIRNRIDVCCCQTCFRFICSAGIAYTYSVADSVWDGVNESVRNSVGDSDFVGQTIKEINHE